MYFFFKTLGCFDTFQMLAQCLFYFSITSGDTEGTALVRTLIKSSVLYLNYHDVV